MGVAISLKSMKQSLYLGWRCLAFVTCDDDEKKRVKWKTNIMQILRLIRSIKDNKDMRKNAQKLL